MSAPFSRRFFLGGALAAAALRPGAARAELPRLDPAERGLMTRQILPNLFATLAPRYVNPGAEAALLRLARPFLGQAPGLKWSVIILDLAKAAAGSLPDGTLWVSRGLLLIAAQPWEIQAALGHQAAHVSLDHHLNRIDSGVLSIFNPTTVPDLIVRAREPLLETAMHGFSDDQERAADLWMVKALAVAGLMPERASHLYHRLLRLKGKGRDKDCLGGDAADIITRIGDMDNFARTLPPGLESWDWDGFKLLKQLFPTVPA